MSVYYENNMVIRWLRLRSATFAQLRVYVESYTSGVEMTATLALTTSVRTRVNLTSAEAGIYKL